MDREYSCIDRYFRNVSTQRLVLYGIGLVFIIVVIILLITLLPGGDNSTPSPQPKPSGRAALQNVPLIDGHNNLPEQLMQTLQGAVSSFPFDKNLAKDEKFSWSDTDIPRLKEGMVGVQIWSVKADCSSQYKDAVAKTMQQLDAISRLIDKYKNDMKMVSSLNDLSNSFKDKKIGSMLSIEGGLSVDNKLSVLRSFSRIGVRVMSLVSECSTPWAGSYTQKKDSKLVLTDFGQTVVKEMNRLGMVIDLAGSSTNTQLKVLEASKAPCIFSSSAAYSLYPSEKNIQDSVLDAIKKNRGLVMVTMDGNFLDDQKTKKTIPIDDFIKQLNFFREKVGVDNVGIGAGFNLNSRLPVQNLEDSSKYPELFDRLAKPPNNNEVTWSIEELEKLAGLNFQRVLKDVEDLRDKSTEGPYENLIPDSDIPSTAKACYSK